MRVVTAAEMREVDRCTISLGIPETVLMENAGHRVVEFLADRFAPLERQRIVILCGKGNNGGDGIVVARQLFTRYSPASLDIVLAEAPPDNLRSLEACGFTSIHREIAPSMRAATIVIDSLLGTGLTGLPRPPYLDFVHQVNTGFPAARIVAVDIPSGMNSDSAETSWPHVRAHHTVTFTAPKVGMVLEPNRSACGELVVGAIGSPESILPAHTRWTERRDFERLLAARPAAGHKGTFGHVLVVGGSPGKSGAVAMTGMAALRAGAGLVTVASEPSTLPAIAAHAPELMTAPFDEHGFAALAKGKRVLAVGPGMGVSSAKSAFLQRVIAEHDVPTVIDADGLNNLSAAALPRRSNLILTPHPGEMERLTGQMPSIDDRLADARAFAQDTGVTLVLKGHDTLTAFPDGTVWINSTGGPAMATGGSGDILTGLIAGMAAQFPDSLPMAVVAAVWLHGRAGDLAAEELGDKCVIATDLLRYLPKAMRP